MFGGEQLCLGVKRGVVGVMGCLGCFVANRCVGAYEVFGVQIGCFEVFGGRKGLSTTKWGVWGANEVLAMG